MIGNFGICKKLTEMFSDLKVLELASVLAGPSVGQFFAELGADVVKVENLRTRGDVTRSWKGNGENTDDRSAYFCSVNSGKRSIALDLESSEGHRVVEALCRRSDIVIASYKPGDAEKLKVDYKTLSAINPSLIYGMVTGYGSHNKRVGYDAIIQAEAGFMCMNGEPGGPSLKMPVALMDVLAAHQLKEALLLAIIQKAKTGKGALAEVSLISSAVSSLVNQATNWLVAKTLPLKQGSMHPNIAPYGETFLTIDGKEVLLAIGNDRQFIDLCQILDLQELCNDSDYINNSARVVNRERLYIALKERIGSMKSEMFLARCNERKIPVGLIQNMQEVFSMPEARQMILESLEVYGLKTFAASVSGMDLPRAILPPPHFGQHTVSILQELNL
jgi:crotonobetainyl-CoA:carnitine CoA-transferase CaiB-like acyl-CoA transferase